MLSSHAVANDKSVLEDYFLQSLTLFSLRFDANK